VQVSEQVLKAFGIETCAGLIANRGLLAALFSPVSTDFFMAVGLGIGRAEHGQSVDEGAIGRKGISNERTFAAVSAAPELEAKASQSGHR
jgi:DNA polymerase kappa